MGFERPTLAQEMLLHLWPRTDVLGGLGQVASPLWGPVTQALTSVGEPAEAQGGLDWG